jgi:LPS O-antigen subunit length determinant protein (WzzB/FepE family)
LNFKTQNFQEKILKVFRKKVKRFRSTNKPRGTWNKTEYIYLIYTGIMDTKARIKVIKRSEQQPKLVVKKAKDKPKTAQMTAREMASAVSGWVNEFQQKRREETKEALKQLFPNTPTPTGCANC